MGKVKKLKIGLKKINITRLDNRMKYKIKGGTIMKLETLEVDDGCGYSDGCDSKYPCETRL